MLFHASTLGILLSLFITLLLGACAAFKRVPVPVDVIRPAEHPLPSGSKLAVAGFEGKQGSTIADKLTAKLVGTQRYVVLDRKYVEKILEEQRLPLSKFYELPPDGKAKIGKLLGAQFLVLGSIHNFDVTDRQSTIPLPKLREVRGRDRRGREQTYLENTQVNAKSVSRQAFFDGTFQVIDVTTGVIESAKSSNLKSEEYINIVDPQPNLRDANDSPKFMSRDLPDKTMLLSDLQDTAIEAMVRHVASVTLPEVRIYLTLDETTDTTLSMFKARQYEAAASKLDAVLTAPGALQSKEPVEIAVYYYDCGLCWEMLRSLDKAEAYLARAIELYDEDLFPEALLRIKQRKEEEARIESQR